MNTAIARNAPTCASRLADQIAWADANGYTAMAALGVWTRIIALVWRALDTDAGADAIERVRGERPGGDRPAQHLIVETQAIRIAGALRLVDDADIGALTRAQTSVMTRSPNASAKTPGPRSAPAPRLASAHPRCDGSPMRALEARDGPGRAGARTPIARRSRTGTRNVRAGKALGRRHKTSSPETQA